MLNLNILLFAYKHEIIYMSIYIRLSHLPRRHVLSAQGILIYMITGIQGQKRHLQNLTSLAVVIGIGIPVLIDIISVFIPALRAMFFELLFVVYTISIPLGFIIFLYTIFLRQKLTSMNVYW